MDRSCAVDDKRSRLSLLLGFLLALGLVVSPLAAPRAQAAQIPVTDLAVAVDRHEVTAGWNEPVATTLNFCTPGSASAGDTFTVKLPQALGNWPASFQVLNPDGVVMYEVSIGGDPAVATFTFTAAGNTAANRCSIAKFGGTATKPAGAYPLTYVVNDTQELSAGELTVRPPAYPLPSGEYKNAWFTTTSDECRTDPVGCLSWRLVSRVGPGATVVADEPAGTNWTWACDRMGTTYLDLEVVTYENGQRRWVSGRTDPNVARLVTNYSCTHNQVHIEVNTASLQANQSLELALLGTANAPGEQGGVTYLNTATMNVNGEGPRTYPVRLESKWVGGVSAGDHVSITKSDAAGNAGDTEATAVPLPSGGTELRLVVRNTGENPLTDIEVTDALVSGTGRVTGLACDFSAHGGPSAATTWAGPLPSGKHITCRATLSDVVGSHQDRATVTARGSAPISQTNDFWASATVNLTLAKKVVSTGPYAAGSTVVFELTPSNTGTIAAKGGWSVTEVLPAGLSLVSMNGPGYTCAGDTCTRATPLAAGASADPVRVEARVDAGTVGTPRNVAYVSPAASEIAETNPLVVPGRDTDTDATATDNDASVQVEVRPLVSVGDRVWRDDNRNGLQDVGEPGLEGVEVRLTNGGTTRTARTNADGYYWFDSLIAGTDGRLNFTLTEGHGWTIADVDGASSDDIDSDVNAAGEIAFTAPAAGSNRTGAALTDQPNLDAGMVRVNLRLAAQLATTGTVTSGSTVVFTLTPHNDGPSTALAGWSVTEVLPAGLSLVSMSGPGYTCAAATCTAAATLPGNTDGPVLTVIATVDAGFTGELRNVAYIRPAANEVVESNPLHIPDGSTDPDATASDNDAGVQLRVEARGQAPAPEIRPSAPAPKPWPNLADTGSPIAGWQVGLAVVTLLAGATLVTARLRAYRS